MEIMRKNEIDEDDIDEPIKDDESEKDDEKLQRQCCTDMFICQGNCGFKNGNESKRLYFQVKIDMSRSDETRIIFQSYGGYRNSMCRSQIVKN